MCSLDDPAVPAQAVFAFDAFAGNARCDTALAQITSASSIVVAVVSMQFAGAFPRSPVQARHGRDSIQCAFERY